MEIVRNSSSCVRIDRVANVVSYYGVFFVVSAVDSYGVVVAAAGVVVV